MTVVAGGTGFLGRAVAGVERAIDDPAMSGTYHLVAPEPITNRTMMATLRRLVGRFGPPAPSVAIRIGAWLQGSAPSLVLASQRAVPRRLVDAGFADSAPTFEAAARRALGDQGDSAAPAAP